MTEDIFAGGLSDEKTIAEVSTAGGSSPEGSDAGEVLSITGEDALKYYVACFGAELVLGEDGEIQACDCGRRTLCDSGSATARPLQETGYDVPKDLYPYMGLDACDQAKALFTPAARITKTSDVTPFRYVAGLDKDASFSLFDTRDEICMQVGGFRHGQVVRDHSGGELIVVGVKLAEGVPQLWFQPRDLGRAGSGYFSGASREELRARFSSVTSGSAHVVQNINVRQLRQVSVNDWCAAEDDDGEEVVLCRQCHLPLGDFACAGEDKEEALVHGECLAQLLLKNLREDQAAKRAKEQAVKTAKRAEYGIGWRVPEEQAHSLSCLVFDEESRTVRVAPTLEPAAAVNLEYLSQALEVRLKEGREPLFSLDMADPFDPACMQTKRFEPAWLAGTPAGEVLFQADYHLKELSMGEYEQPITGMKSALDYYETEGRKDRWSAREWFMVKEAAVHLSQDNVMIPFLKMSVEAREQIVGQNGCEDVKITRHDHPLVKYAEAFTDNFDLIAERKSVVHHLRELAKASILAKFLADQNIDIADISWLHISEPEEGNQALEGLIMEVPQLWNERFHSKVTLQDGKIINAGDGDTITHSVYGGVQFGLERFDLAEPPRGWQLPLRPSAVVRAYRMPTPAAAPPSIKAASVAARSGAPGMKVTRRVPGVGAQGVDLNLDQFDLSEAERNGHLDGRLFEASVGVSSAAFGEAFWKSLEDQPTAMSFQDKDQQLLGSVFNPYLSDRKEKEGATFLPPDGGMAYVEELRKLVHQELLLQRQRKAHFLSSKFSDGDAGPLFPASWTDPVALARTALAEEKSFRSDYLAAAPVFAHILRSATPDFDKRTEDGTHFRIYSFGSVEIRTTQAHDGKEEVGAVFSLRPSGTAKAQGCKDGCQVVKVTEYVEWERGCQEKDVWHHSYVVVETNAGKKVVTEQLRDGTVTWEESPKDLEDRCSLAKVIRCAECASAGLLLQDVERFQCEQVRKSRSTPFVFHGHCKQYARAVYGLASGSKQPQMTRSGFRQRAKGQRNERLSTVGVGGWHGARGQRNVKQTVRIALRK